MAASGPLLDCPDLAVRVSSAGICKSRTPAAAGVNRAEGKPMDRDWCGRPVLYSLRQASTAACASPMLANGACTLSNSCCSIWCSRSILPLVVLADVTA